ncbi:chemotaxis protein CheD [Deltaproteobacteria bacterium TL4]
MILRRSPNIPFIYPGYSFLPSQPVQLWTILGADVAVTLFDRRLKKGGMTHYSQPYRERGKPSTAIYAAPAIVSLVKMFLDSGSQKKDLEAQIFGGASNPNHQAYHENLHENNVKIGFELLETQDIPVVSMEVGGNRGRKVGFHTYTGETVIVKCNHIREADWYPQLCI